MFFEMACPGCGSPVRWSGGATAPPKYGQCGYQTLTAELAGDAAEVDRFRDFLDRRKRKKLAGAEDRDYINGK